ncbi:LCP family protein [Actinokineospora sp. G85]|uniref:LCP family protein n=1 Tax=Actinokineospora sp. G85 TaxID=3406626 RepID=UPI003C763FB4
MEYRPPGAGSGAGRDRPERRRGDGPARGPRPAERHRPTSRERRQPPPERREPPVSRGRSRDAEARAAREPKDRRVPPPRRVPDAAVETEKITPRQRPCPAVEPDRRRFVGVKVLLTLLSTAVVAGTGYYWKVQDDLAGALTRHDVIAGGPTERPADGAIDILMVGVDSRIDAQGNPLSREQLAMLSAGVADGELNTDTIMVIRVPNDGAKAAGVSIPRDSYVDIPGFGKNKINSAYLRGKAEARAKLQAEGVEGRDLELRSNQEGAKTLIEAVNKLTGATIDHYAEVNLLGFYDITNAIGGVEVCLKDAVRDRYSGANFPAGVQTISGTSALAFVRQRHGLPGGDFDRIVRQQTFMGAMAKKVFSQDVIAPGSSTLPKLQEAISKSVVLDRNWDIMRFAQQMTRITGGNVTFQTIPTGNPELRTPDGALAIEIEPAEVRRFVDDLLHPDRPASSTPGSSEPNVDKPTVNVLNGSGKTGLAAEVATTLTGDGFTEGATGNAAGRAKTVIRHAPGAQAEGKDVAASLGGNYTVEPDSDLDAGSVTVILGRDYAAKANLAGEPLLDLGAPLLAQEQPGGPPCIN